MTDLGEAVLALSRQHDSALMAMLLTLPRLHGFLTTSQLLPSTAMPRLARSACILILAMFVAPINMAYAHAVPHDPFSYAMFTAKEYAIGMVLGFVVGWVAWAVQSAGSLIDNQRGASMASMIDPLHGEETSSLGILLSQAFMTYILATGTFLALFGMLFQSYAIWPATRALPLLDDRFPTLVLNLVDYAFRYAIVLSGPLVAAMFLSEFALAIVSRFSPQVQVFVLAMPIKSAIAIFMLIFYFGVILSASDHELLHAETVLNRLYEMIGAEGPAALPPGGPP